jgi:NAD(P)-dependent dehydrogenase (short-subunit alcohol dehydrogenase family)
MSTRAAIVTGASRGIGRAIAEALAEDGYALTISARKPDTLEATATAFRAKGYEVEPVPANMADEDGIKSVVEPIASVSAGSAGQQRRCRHWCRGR